MDIDKFIAKKPFLYHLTDRRNLAAIKAENTLFSTVSLASKVYTGKALRDFITGRRPDHAELEIDGSSIFIRDQQPISMMVLARSLTENWTCEDFIKHLNKRVFFWPTVDRLCRHYDRYAEENPVILRVRTEEMLELNPHAEFCRLNSGATRCSSHWGGNAPERGRDTFQTYTEYSGSVASVAEVTFPGECILPDIVWRSASPGGPWRTW